MCSKTKSKFRVFKNKKFFVELHFPLNWNICKNFLDIGIFYVEAFLWAVLLFSWGKNIRWYRRLVDLPNESDKATRQIESSNIHDQVASFDSIANAQTDMICHYDEVVNFDSIPGNQNDSFLSLFLLFFQNFYFLTFDFEIRGCVMFSNTS